MLHALLESAQLLAEAARAFDAFCARGIEPDLEVIRRHLDASLMLVTALTPHIGYEKAAAIAQTAHRDGLTLKEAAVGLGYVTAERVRRLGATRGHDAPAHVSPSTRPDRRRASRTAARKTQARKAPARTARKAAPRKGATRQSSPRPAGSGGSMLNTLIIVLLVVVALMAWVLCSSLGSSSEPAVRHPLPARGAGAPACASGHSGSRYLRGTRHGRSPTGARRTPVDGCHGRPPSAAVTPPRHGDRRRSTRLGGGRRTRQRLMRLGGSTSSSAAWAASASSRSWSRPTANTRYRCALAGTNSRMPPRSCSSMRSVAGS